MNHTFPTTDHRSTPWGWADTCKEVAPGVIAVTTSSHGGLKISLENEAQIPEGFRRRYWYEEDCDWAIVQYFVGNIFPEKNEKMREEAIRLLKYYYPYEWEAHTGETIPPGVSHKKDLDLYYADHADRYIVMRAHRRYFGNCNWVPDNCVGVEAVLGGERQPDPTANPPKFFLVPEAEYFGHIGKEKFPFIVDPDRHQQVHPFSTTYIVDIRDRNTQAVTSDSDEVPVEDQLRFYKITAASPQDAFEQAIDIARQKLSNMYETLNEYYKPSNGLPQNTGTIPLIIDRIALLQSYVENGEAAIAQRQGGAA